MVNAKICYMADANPVDGHDEPFIQTLQLLRQHVQALHELTLDVEGLKVVLKNDQVVLFEQQKEKTRGEIAFAVSRQFELIDATIQRIRGT
jgi:hypothetical protein